MRRILSAYFTFDGRGLRALAVAALSAVFGATLIGGDARAESAADAQAAEHIIVASTTSPDNSGLYRFLFPHFSAETGIAVRVIAVGTGHALNIGRRGDADMVIVHDESLEREFVASGYGIERQALMYNEYVLVGPRADAAATRRQSSLVRAFDAIAAVRARFVSRGDESGTHKQEDRLWRQTQNGAPRAEWYIKTGNGMGATLQMAKELGAYTLSDTATWLSFGNKQGLAVLLHDRPPLKNIYSIILVNPRKHAGVRHKKATLLRDWLLSPRGQGLIRDFRVRGQALFYVLSEE